MQLCNSAFVVGAVLAAAPMVSAVGQSAGVEYPDNYRDWTRVKSMVIQEGHGLYESFGGIHHIYANEEALQGYKNGAFPKGAVIVFELLEAKQAENAIVEGHKKVVGVMKKDNEQFKTTGGWGFEGFALGDPSRPAVGEKAAADCFGCHTSQQERDYVFSEWAEAVP